MKNVKKFVIPACLIIVFLSLIIVSTIIYFTTSSGKQIIVEGDFTINNLIELNNKLQNEFNANKEDIYMLNDSSIKIEEDKIIDINFHIAVKSREKIEYWQLQNCENGIKLILSKKLKEIPIVTVYLEDMFKSLILADENLNEQVYSAHFSTSMHHEINNLLGESFYIKEGAFFKVEQSIKMDCYAFTVTQGGNIRVFYY